MVLGLMLSACSVMGTGASTAVASAEVGKPAPGFELPDLAGTTHSLEQYKGKTVVLEWFNPGCPFVQHVHNADGVLETMASESKKDEIVWLAINSGAPGKQGHGVETNKKAKADWKMDHPVLLDEKGTVGKAYGAATTPEMAVIDASGKLIYWGAVDNAPLGKVKGAHRNHVAEALKDHAAGVDVRVDHSKPYGCSVKY